MSDYYLVTDAGRDAYAKIMAVYPQTAPAAGYDPVVIAGRGARWYGDSALKYVVEQAENTGCQLVDDVDLASSTAAIMRGWLRKATREEVLVYSLKGTL